MDRVSIELGGRELTIETGRMAKLANGAVLVRYGETMVLVTAVCSKEDKEGLDFFPLTMEYREKAYAVGKIPGGFFKREGKPKDTEVLSARLMDRPIRPLFPDGFRRETQVFCTVLSSDQKNSADVLGITGASAALTISNIPFSGPIAAVRVGLKDGKYILNPTFEEMADSELDLVVAGSAEAIVMVEGGAKEISEDEMVGALSFASEHIKPLVEMQNQLAARVGKPKIEVSIPEIPEDLKNRVLSLSETDLAAAISITDKQERADAISTMKKRIIDELNEDFPESEGDISRVIYDREKEMVRLRIVRDHTRLDGRGFDDIREITCEVGLLPRTHGSSLFTRGQTQSLTTVTLGTKMDEQKIEDLEGESWKSYMLHYNFPSYSVGEVRPIRGPGRREIGHGALAERAIEPVMPSEDVFPYTVRIVSDILESNGSSSMATVCAGSLALMDSGVPIRASVAGIAMGLIKTEDEAIILTDILGDEDHLGDMDLKVAGTKDGITAFQMDLKISGIALEEMGRALEKARDARFRILGTMDAAIAEPRSNLSPFAPRITILKVKTDRIGDIIGPGGKMIRRITEETGAQIDIDDDGTVIIAAVDEECSVKAREWIEGLVEEAEVGKVYTGKVKRITNFGAFVEILPGKEGLVHISKLAHHRVERVEDVLNEGDILEVQCIGIDEQGRIDLSRKALLPRPDGSVEEDSDFGERRSGQSNQRRSGKRRPPRRGR